jgi:hypothetical protein
MSENIVDIDSFDSGHSLQFGSEETFREVSARRILDEWEYVKTVLGNPPIGDPVIIVNPSHPVHFGITLKWNVILNLASIPADLEGDRMLSWLRTFPMFHEVAHYVICPYDGLTHAKLSLRAKEAWESATRDELFFIVNFFSDIIINDELFRGIVGEQFFDALKKWVEWTTTETLKRNHRISNPYLVFILIHELLWKRRFSTFEYPDIIKRVASKIANSMVVSSWYDSVYLIASFLKTMMLNDNQNGNPGHGVEVLTKSFAAAVKEAMKGSEQKDGSGEGKESGGNGKNEIPTTMVGVKKGGMVTKKPFDMTLFMGDTTSEKTRGKVDLGEKENEISKAYAMMARSGMTFPVAAAIMKQEGIVTSDDEAWRLWLRSRAKGMMKYETRIVNPRLGDANPVPSTWEWSDPVKDWNVITSITSFPPFPFPPFATGSKPSRGTPGQYRLPDARDIIIMRDSSGSMNMQMADEDDASWKGTVDKFGYQNSKFNISSLATFAALHAAADRGANFSVINFSGSIVGTGWMKPGSAQISAAEKVILQFLHGTTILPVKELKVLLEGRKKCFVLVITDSFIYNWNEFFPLANTFSDSGHSMSMIFISGNKERVDDELLKSLDDLGVYLHFVRSSSDLIGITLKEIHRIYR